MKLTIENRKTKKVQQVEVPEKPWIGKTFIQCRKCQAKRKIDTAIPAVASIVLKNAGWDEARVLCPTCAKL